MTALNGFPTTTSVGQGLFNVSSVGMIQGPADPDPATRFALRGGVVSANETVPMWGGLGVYADVPPISTSGPKQPLGPVVGRAATVAAILGFTVFDQSYNLTQDPANPVPTAGSGQSINYYPLGCRARIAVACDPALISLRGGALNAQVGWDLDNQRLEPYSPGYSQTTITDAVWASTNGGQTTYTVSSDLTADLSPGDTIDVAAVVNAGGSSTGAFNGNWEVVSVSSTTIVVAAPASASLGTYASGGHVNAAASNAIAVTVLDVQPTGCMTVQNIGGVQTWNYNGACAKIQLTGGTVS